MRELIENIIKQEVYSSGGAYDLINTDIAARKIELEFLTKLREEK